MSKILEGNKMNEFRMWLNRQQFTLYNYKKIKEIIEYAEKLRKENEQLKKIANWLVCECDPGSPHDRRRLEKKVKELKALDGK